MVSTKAKNAARVVMEFEGLELRLSDARTDALDVIDRVVLTESQDYFLDSTAAKRVALHEAEWSIYRYASLLHALDELVIATKFVSRSSVTLLRDIPHPLIAVRNCIHHNGPVGLNYDDAADEVLIELSILKQEGDWHKPQVKPFGSYFPQYDPAGPQQFLDVEQEIRQSKQRYETLITDSVSEIERRIGKQTLRKAASSVTLYS